MASIYDNPNLQNAQTASSQATQAYNTAATDQITLADSLKEALNKKLGTGNPLIQQREGALTNFLNTSTQAPLDYTAKSAGGNSDVVYSPLQQANLIQGRRSAALAPITTLNTLLGLETGGVGNIIDSVSRANQARVAGLQGNAQLAQQNYTNILDVLKAKADEQYKNASLAYQNKGIGDLLPLLQLLTGGGSTNRPDITSALEDSSQPQVYTTPEGVKYTVDSSGQVQPYNPNTSNQPLSLNQLGMPANLKLNLPKNNSGLNLAGGSTSPFSGVLSNFSLQ